MKSKNKGKLFIFSAPSGAGKTTLVKNALAHIENLQFSVSCTTREKRPNEIDGKDYYFITAEDFKNKIANLAFIEWEEVYKDNFYGTLKSEVNRILEEGKSVIFDIDVEGGLNIKKLYPDNSLTIFVHPPDITTLKIRLIERNTESEDKLKQRLDKADKELKLAPKFDVILVNDDLEIAKKESIDLILKNIN